MSGLQYINRSKYSTYAHNNRKFGHSLRPLVVFFLVHEGVMEEEQFWWIFILMAEKLACLSLLRHMRELM